MTGEMTIYRRTFMRICHKRNTSQIKIAAACDLTKDALLTHLDFPMYQPIGMIDVYAKALRCTVTERSELWDAYRHDIEEYMDHMEGQEATA